MKLKAAIRILEKANELIKSIVSTGKLIPCHKPPMGAWQPESNHFVCKEMIMRIA